MAHATKMALAMPPRAPIVTTHALRRYGERMLCAEGLSEDDPDAIIQLEELYDFDQTTAMAEIAAIVHRGLALGASAVTFGGLRFVLRDGAVITAVPKHDDRKRRRRVARGED